MYFLDGTFLDSSEVSLTVLLKNVKCWDIVQTKKDIVYGMFKVRKSNYQDLSKEDDSDDAQKRNDPVQETDESAIGDSFVLRMDISQSQANQRIQDEYDSDYIVDDPDDEEVEGETVFLEDLQE
ncbi:hypothetical protein QAD02_024210 [Eretmocerus hayati]|uniref:Uncharacterized protein n=1 Tax=Eretmocerus hayati TaxID=131215 RepID=A0ACC2PYD2_9HYME|nr:hypothetical protein QAD02_024210 [Eretmocerus hayati]